MYSLLVALLNPARTNTKNLKERIIGRQKVLDARAFMSYNIELEAAQLWILGQQSIAASPWSQDMTNETVRETG